MVTGPLFSLRLWGTFCPCCERSEDKSARQSLQQLNRLGTRISWHTTKRNSKMSAGGLMKSIFGRSNSNASGDSGTTDEKPPTQAQLKLVDTTKDSINCGEPYPELQICPKKGQAEAIGDNDDSGGPLRQNSAMSFQLDIPLHHIQRIESVDTTMVVIYTKDVHAIDEKAANSEKEAARISFSSSNDRDAASLDLKVLVEWNKQRQPEVEEDLPATGIRHRAQKAAHFAKREIEMREKKRDREKRKAGHMKGMTSGGLKYTAMAMTNQSTMT
mmetsp:Transcript_9917/g.20651  ORF Transcript_9917/g.20651 Transcript_9917/m.20651 type:complete len:272 (-) Transcript_9917:136-951(-)